MQVDATAQNAAASGPERIQDSEMFAGFPDVEKRYGEFDIIILSTAKRGSKTRYKLHKSALSQAEGFAGMFTSAQPDAGQTVPELTLPHSARKLNKFLPLFYPELLQAQASRFLPDRMWKFQVMDCLTLCTRYGYSRPEWLLENTLKAQIVEQDWSDRAALRLLTYASISNKWYLINDLSLSEEPAPRRSQAWEVWLKDAHPEVVTRFVGHTLHTRMGSKITQYTVDPCSQLKQSSREGEREERQFLKDYHKPQSCIRDARMGRCSLQGILLEDSSVTRVAKHCTMCAFLRASANGRILPCPRECSAIAESHIGDDKSDLIGTCTTGMRFVCGTSERQSRYGFAPPQS